MEEHSGPSQRLSAGNRRIKHVKTKIFNLIAKLTAVATIASSFYMVSPVKAGAFTTMSDTMTRLQNGQAADHSVVFTLPAAIDFDVTGNTDVILVDFDAADFTIGGTWVTGDFTFNDGTLRTIDAVAEGAGTTTVSCVDGVDNVGVAIDTTDYTFRIIPCGATFTASGAAATVTFTVDGTTTDGTLTNNSTGASQVSLSMTDEGTASAHSGDAYVYLVDSDQVTITADVNPSMTFDLDTSIATGGDSAAAYSVALGTLDSASTASSGDGTIRMIGIDLASNATGGTVVTVRSGNATGLCSVSTGTDCIAHTGTDLVAGTAGYGICVNRVATTSGTLAATAFDDDALTATGGYDVSATCTATLDGLSDALTTSAQSIIASTAAVDGGRAEVFVKAAISSLTPAHDDYQDTLTFIATGTF